MLDNFKNFVTRLIYKENIAMFAHNLDNKRSLDMVPNLVFIGNRDFHDTIVFNLLD